MGPEQDEELQIDAWDARECLNVTNAALKREKAANATLSHQLAIAREALLMSRGEFGHIAAEAGRFGFAPIRKDCVRARERIDEALKQMDQDRP